jgi:hypothetical protein
LHVIANGLVAFWEIVLIKKIATSQKEATIM